VHCRNKECRYFDARYSEKVQKEEKNSSFMDRVEKLILLRGQVADEADADDDDDLLAIDLDDLD